MSKYNKSICYVNGKLISNVLYTTKIIKMNRIEIKIEILPKIKYEYWANINFNSMIKL